MAVTSGGLNIGGTGKRPAGGPVTLTWGDLYTALEWSGTDGPLGEDTPLPTGPNMIRHWQNLLATVTTLVDRYAPGAPSEIKNEAAIRTGGYLQQHPMSGISQDALGPKQLSFNTSQLSALRHSGAMALLSPWKMRRAL